MTVEYKEANPTAEYLDNKFWNWRYENTKL
jgi:hypothetical protein